MQIIEVTSPTQGNLYGSVRNQIKRKIHGTFESLFFFHDSGQIKRIYDGKIFDWWINENGSLTVNPSE